MESREDRLRRRIVLFALAFCYLYPFPYFEALNNPNEHVRLYMTTALVEDGTYAIDGPTARYGWVNDRATRGGRLYAGKAPGASLLGVPVYAAARWVSGLVGLELDRRAAVRLLRLVVVTAPSLALLVVFRRFLDDLGGEPWLRDAVLVAYGLGSMAYGYGMMFAGHQLAAVALTGALVAFHAAAKRLEAGAGGVAARVAVGGLLLGAAPAMEYPAAVGALALAAYAAVVLRGRPALVGLAAALAVVSLLPVLHFHASAFGSPFAFPYDFIENPAFQRLLAEGWHGASHPRLDRLATILFAPSFGLLFFTPLLVLAPLGVVARARAWREAPPSSRHLVWALPVAAAALVLYLATSALWRAGWALGPRYVASAVPLLAIASLWGGEALLRRWRGPGAVLVALLVLLSVLHAGTSGALYPHQPEPFDNPVYDLTLPLLAMGFAPHTLAEIAGVRGWPSLLPLGLAAALALALIAAGPGGSARERLARGAVVLALAAATAGALSRYGEDGPAERRLLALVVRTWEPAGHSVPERRLEAFRALEAPSSDELRAAAREHARLGRDREAAALVRRAEELEGR